MRRQPLEIILDILDASSIASLCSDGRSLASVSVLRNGDVASRNLPPPSAAATELDPSSGGQGSDTDRWVLVRMREMEDMRFITRIEP